MADTVLVEQPTKKPVRKVRLASYVLAGLTTATFILGLFTGQESISQDEGLRAIGVLLSGGIPLVTAYFAKSETTEAGE